MTTTTAVFGLLVAALSVLAGCGARTQAIHRSLTGLTSGGNEEVWIVMGETASESRGADAVITRDAYVVYRCIPKGCKRIGELGGSRAYRQ
jgi:hypothetical protein